MLQEDEETIRQAQTQQMLSQGIQHQEQQQYLTEQRDKGLAEEQLDVEETLKKIYHLLKQDIYSIDSDGKVKWTPQTDKRKIRLTDAGVEKFMEIMGFYINKENLLSNFSEEQINNIMLHFQKGLTANILMRYDLYFKQPTIKECESLLFKRIDEQVELRLFDGRIKSLKLNKEKVKKQLLDEMKQRDKIENEIKNIREREKKENLAEFEMLWLQLSQMVLATLNRAWKGEERGSLRRHTHISELVGTQQPQQQAQKRGFFGWGRKD